MMKVLSANERGHANFGWLDSRHSFSFGDYYNPRQMGFRALRVINEDRVAAGAGFPMHPHRDMEIITYVISGSLQHQDTLGNTVIIRPGEVQKMSAGTGIRHSEFNPSQTEGAHFLQIWILPDKEGIKPTYGQKFFDEDLKSKGWVLAVSPDAAEGSIRIQQDARLYVGRLKTGTDKSVTIQPNRFGWVQVVKGEVRVGEQILKAGDGLEISESGEFKISTIQDCEILFFDLA
jgi:redox-sensitive bicupin YhaK (pirin superfamily)